MAIGKSQFASHILVKLRLASKPHAFTHVKRSKWMLNWVGLGFPKAQHQTTGWEKTLESPMVWSSLGLSNVCTMGLHSWNTSRDGGPQFFGNYHPCHPVGENRWDVCSSLATRRLRIWYRNVIAHWHGTIKSPYSSRFSCSMRASSLGTMQSGLPGHLPKCPYHWALRYVWTIRAFRVVGSVFLGSSMACSKVAIDPVVLTYSTKKSRILLCPDFCGHGLRTKQHVDLWRPTVFCTVVLRQRVVFRKDAVHVETQIQICVVTPIWTVHSPFWWMELWETCRAIASCLVFVPFWKCVC